MAFPESSDRRILCRKHADPENFNMRLARVSMPKHCLDDAPDIDNLLDSALEEMKLVESPPDDQAAAKSCFTMEDSDGLPPKIDAVLERLLSAV